MSDEKLDKRFTYKPHTPRSASAEAWSENFSIRVYCKRCNGVYEYEQPIIGTEKVPHKHQRTVTIFAPETCPDCCSLHAVPSPLGLDTA